MGDLTSHLLNNPRGREYTYAVRIRGLPYLWTDGRADWTYSDAAAVIRGGLGKTDFSFDFKSDATDPLEVGSGLTIHLVDEPSRRTRYLFSPERRGAYTYIVDARSPGILPTTTSIDVVDASTLATNQYAYVGLETVQISNISSNNLTVVRGAFGSLPRRWVSFQDEGSSTNYNRGLQITSLPTVMAGRHVDVYMATVEPDGTASTTDRWTVWAGRLGSYKLTGRSVRLSVDPLNASMTKDEWPAALPTGVTNSDQVMIFLTEQHFTIEFAVTTNGPASGLQSGIDAGRTFNLGRYNTGGTFVPYTVPTGGASFSLGQIAALLTDTLVAGISSISVNDNYEYLRSNLSLGVNVDGRITRLVGTNATYLDIELRGPLIQKLIAVDSTVSPGFLIWPVLPHQSTNKTLLQFNRTGYLLDAQLDKLIYFPQPVITPDANLFGCRNTEEDEMHAYVKVSDGAHMELMSYSAVASSFDGTLTMELEDRALCGTKRSNFGSGDSLDQTNVAIVSMVRTGEAMDAADVLLAILLSIDGETGNNSDYDILGSQVGLGIHKDFVDIDGIRSRMRMGDMPKPYAYWSETGKGKDSLREFCKAHGVYFVTRRFTRNGAYLFGLSVDLVDVPVVTRYNATLNDDQVLADSIPDIDVNERMLINSIKITPRYEFDKGTGDTGGERFVTAGDSIAKYGRSKTLEISANAYFNAYSSQYGGSYNGDEAITAAIATHIGIRWFGAYADGNYAVAIECPHIGWAYQAGDRVLVQTTGGISPEGSDGLDNVAKIMEVKHVHGLRAGANITARISTTRAVELAPCFSVTSIAGSVLTIDANAFSDSFNNVPFYGQTGPCKDGHFFDRSQHGANFNVQLWYEGDFANRESVTVASVDIAGGTLTLTAPPSLTVPTNARLLGTIPAYAASQTSLNNSYAHIGTSEARSVLDSGLSTETEAFEWA